MSNPNFVERLYCPACKSTNFKLIYKTSFLEEPLISYLKSFYTKDLQESLDLLIDVEYILNECNNCKLLFQGNIPNDQLMETLYERWIASTDDINQCNTDSNIAYFADYAQEIMQIIAYIDKSPSSVSMMDFGMGWGKWSEMAKAFGCKSYGHDLSEIRSNYAKNNGIIVLSHEEIPNYLFDFINTEQVFEHLSDPLQTLIFLRNSLKINGIIKISVPTANDMNRRLRIMDWKALKGGRNSLNPIAPLEHINCYRRKSLLAMASAADLEPVYIPILTQYRFLTNWSGFKRIAKNILMPIYINILRRRNYIFLKKTH